MNWEQVQREVHTRTARSSGAGGQHVNKVETKVSLSFYPATSLAFTPAEQTLVLTALADQLSQDGALTVTSQEGRSQAMNRRRAWQKLENLLRLALRPPKPPRKAVQFRPNPAARRAEKARHSAVKALRRPPGTGEM